MSKPFTISCDWLESEQGDSPEEATFAEVAINVDDHNATLVIDVLAEDVRPTARLSALPLAEWFAANWWRLIWELRSDTYDWLETHNVRNVGYGYVWPDLSFSSDWESIHVSARPSRGFRVEPIRYLEQFDYHELPVPQFEQGMEDFINQTVARLHSVGDTDTDLDKLWGEVMRERNDPELSQRRALEACMGHDPEEAPADLLDKMIGQMKAYGKSAVQEMAVAHKDQAASFSAYVHQEARRNGMAVSVPNRAKIHSRLTTEGFYESLLPWQRAERAAAIARDDWGVDPPISTERLCDLLSVRQSDFINQGIDLPSPFIAGVRGEGKDDSDSFLASLSRPRETSRRFDLARLVADHIAADADDTLLPATHCYTSRQKFQRAFAQELLCPYDTLREFINMGAPDEDDVQDAAEHFIVSPLVIQTTLVNKGVLHRDVLPN